MHALLRQIVLPILLAVAIVTTGTVVGRADERLRKKIAEVTNLPRFEYAHWGLLVVELSNGKVIFEQNADKLFAPASTTKLYSVATALDALGANYRFETPIHQRGSLNSKGELDGDLILVAS